MRQKQPIEKKKILNWLSFKKAHFEPKIHVSNALTQDYLNRIEVLKLTKEQLQRHEEVINEEKLLKSL